MRRTKIVTITDEGRDKGKSFLLTEWYAGQAFDWAQGVILSMGRAGFDVGNPLLLADAGMAGLAMVGIQSLLKIHPADAKPLLDQMMECVQFMPDPNTPEVFRKLILKNGDGDDIEEVMTLVQLRAEVFSLHTGFSLPGVPQT